MKKLLLILVLGLTLSLPVSSYADINVFGVQLPVGTQEVSDNIDSGYVASDFSDSLHIQKLKNKDNTVSNSNEREKYLVFGVDINSINKI